MQQPWVETTERFTRREAGVIFDMDGVLVDSQTAHLESWKQLAAEIGRTVTEEQFRATFGRTSRDIIVSLFGPRHSDADLRRLDERKEFLYRELIRGRVPAMPGAIELVRSIHAAGLRIAAGSSGPAENVRLVMDELGLHAWVSACVTGQDVTRGKPDPQVFVLAAQRLGLSPRRCVVVEDAPVGIEAGRRAGCRTIGLCGTHGRDGLTAADAVVERLSQITAEMLEGLL